MDELEIQEAKEDIDLFVTQFGEAHLLLAYHAAFPLILTPDLLYHLWARFQRDVHDGLLDVPWVAVADLLLSHLCREIRAETYRLKDPIRRYLLREMGRHPRFTRQNQAGERDKVRLRELAQFLRAYVANSLDSQNPYEKEAAAAQDLNALLYVAPQAAMVQLLQAATQPGSRASTVRIASLSETFADTVTLFREEGDELRTSFEKIREYTRALASLARGRSHTAVAQQFQTAFGSDQYIEIDGQTLPVPDEILQALASLEKKIYTYRATVYDTSITVAKIDTDGIQIDAFTGNINLTGAEQFQTVPTEPEKLRAYGQALFDVLFADELLRTDFKDFYEDARQEGALLRVELDIDQRYGFTQDLAALPWELLCLPDDLGHGPKWLATAPEMLFSRRPSEVAPPQLPRPLPTDEPLRIAVIVGSNAPDESPLVYQPIWEAYQDLARKYPGQFHLLNLLTAPTPSELADLFSQRPHIVHFFTRTRSVTDNNRNEEQVALFRSEAEQDAWVGADELVEIVNAQQPDLVILQSHIFAQPTVNRELQAIATRLGQANIPAVLSWQLPAGAGIPVDRTNTAVTKFIHTVFPALARGIPLDEAVQNGRRTLLNDKNPLAFAAPSLFANTIVRRSNEPGPPTLPASLGVAFAGEGEDVKIVLHQGVPLPATSERITLRREGNKFVQGLGYSRVQVFQGESTFAHQNYQLCNITLDDENLYDNDELEVDVTLTVSTDGLVQVQISHQSGYTRELTMPMVAAENIGTPRVVQLESLIERYTRGVAENSHLAVLKAVSNWLNVTDSERICILTGERGVGKTTVAALLAQFFRGERQPPNNSYDLAPTSTSAVYFCLPSLPETLHPRSFALTIANQWASRDGNFAYLQSTIDNHEQYELEKLVERLLIRPFTDIDELIYPGSIVFLVDDLEAALRYPGEITIVDVILRMLREVWGVRFLLTAQMQPAMRDKLADIEAEFIYLGDRYDNFDIHIGPQLTGPDMRHPITLSSLTDGELSTKTYSPVAQLGYERLERLRDMISNPEQAIEIGQRLFNTLLPEASYETVRRSLEYARSRGKTGLRMRVQFDDPTLPSYPWELCHDGRSYIFSNPDQPILLQRSVPTENVQRQPPLPRPVRLLVVIAAPADRSSSDVSLQEKVIRAATEEAVFSSELDLQILPHATLRQLLEAAQSYQPDIVQFITPGSGEKEGAIILESESGGSNIVPVSEMMRVLGQLSLQCLILSPIGVEVTAVTQLAPQFIQQGIATILAEQFTLPDDTAVAFWSTFYRALLFDRLPPEEALQNARYHLATNRPKPFWGYATLFAGHQTSALTESTSEEIEVLDDDRMRVPNVFFDEESGNVWVFNELIPRLTPLELSLFKKLYEQEGEIVTKEELVSAGWPEASGGVSDDAIISVISRLRKKLEPKSDYPEFISTIRSQGYKLQFYYIQVTDEILLKPLFFNVSSKEVWIYGKPTTLTKSEYRFFTLLYIQRGKIVTKEELIEASLPSAMDDISKELVPTMINWLRQKIEPEPSNPTFILTVPDKGYVLVDHPHLDIAA